jgi:hypothetical protein
VSSNILGAETHNCLQCHGPDPGSGAFFTPGSGIREGKKIQIQDPELTVFGVKTLQFFIADPDQGSVVFLIQDPGGKIGIAGYTSRISNSGCLTQVQEKELKEVLGKVKDYYLGSLIHSV